MPRRHPRRNPLLSANRTPTPEMKDYQEYIDPQLWMLANGGDVQAMYEMSIRGPSHWLPARPNPEADAEYRRNIQHSAKTFRRIGMAIPKGRYPPQVEADLMAEFEKLARTNAGKKGMGRAASAHHRGESRTERESADRMEWRARARAASDEADEQLRQEERERDLKLTLKRAGFTQQQIVNAIRASRAAWVEARKAKKNPRRGRRNPQQYGNKFWADKGMIWKVVAWVGKVGDATYTKHETSYISELPLEDDGVSVDWKKQGSEWLIEYEDGAGNKWLIVACQVPEKTRANF